MSIKNLRLGVIGVLLTLASCNFPTPTPESPTEVFVVTQAEPTLEPSGVPQTPSATAPTTTEAAVVQPTPTVQNPRIAYTDGGNLWAIEIDSAPSQLTDSGGISEVRISDDGEWIAYVVRDPDQDTAELHSVRFDGSNSQVLLDAASFDALYPLGSFIHYTLSKLDFVPGSQTLLFNTRGVFEGPGLAKNDDLLAIDVATGQIDPLLSPGAGGDFTVSPTGDTIAIVRPDSIGFADLNGADLRAEVLTFSPVITYSEYFFYPIPVWSGASVVLPVPQEDPFFAVEPGTVWNVDGGPESLLRPEGDLFGPQRELPIVSPDGSTIAFFRAADASGEQHLVIERLDNGERVIYDTGPIQWKGWAPDSNRMVYTKGTGLDLYMGELGASPVPVGSGAGLRWINANEYLYFAGDPGSWTLTLADLAGNAAPLATPSGSFVAFDFAE